MAVCWERAVPLAFHVCFFVLMPSELHVSLSHLDFFNSIVSVPDHCRFFFFFFFFFIYFSIVSEKCTTQAFSHTKV